MVGPPPHYGSTHSPSPTQSHAHSRSAGLLRPPAPIRGPSSSSIHSQMSTASRIHPHPQHHEYVPTGLGTAIVAGTDASEGAPLDERWQFDQAQEEALIAEGEDPFALPAEDTGHEEAGEEEYNNMRDGSISRRPAWRRPSPRWIFPTIALLAVAIGMTAAPRSEIYVSLACLAHPPAASHEVISMGGYGAAAVYNRPNEWTFMRDQEVNVTLPVLSPTPNASIPISAPVTPHPSPPLSAADEWFLKVQRDMYEWRLHHGLVAPSPVPTPTHTSGISSPAPTGPLPKPPSMPSDGGSSSPPSQDPNGRRPVPPDQSDGRSSPAPPYSAIDPRLCKKDPNVQAAAARLVMVLTLVTGTLAALMTGYWGSVSDRLGRTRVMACVMLGGTLAEATFLFIATYPYLAPGGYRALAIGPALDGLFGGSTTIMATVHAYLADVTPDGSRAGVFSRFAGVLMTGFALGPVLGSRLILMTGNIMSPFYVCIVSYIAFLLIFLFVIPESLSTEARAVLAKNAKLAAEAQARKDAAEREWEAESPTSEVADPFLATPGTMRTTDSTWSRISGSGTPHLHSKRRKMIQGTFKRTSRKALGFLQPLKIFMPRERADGGPGKDWNLTYVGGAMFCTAMMMGIMIQKSQFAMYSYGWQSAQLGPYMSIMAFTRGFVLMILLPVIHKFIKPYFRPKNMPLADQAVVAPPSQPGESAISSLSGASDTPAPPPGPKVKVKRPLKSAKLDLYTARTCVILALIPYACLGFKVSETHYIMLSLMVTLGSPDGPATNSLALGLLPTAREKGRLFGALSVLHALAATIISPLLFGTLFAYTVGWYAPTVFALAAVWLSLALFCLFMVRLPKDKGLDPERGRSTRVKTVRSSSMVAQVKAKLPDRPKHRS